jgi:predicted P-loop ATPase
MDSLNFDELRQIFQGNIRQILADICPGGKLIGSEWTCGTTTGGKGDSFKFNIKTQKWSDFAVGTKGGDIISLYAHNRGIKQIEAARELSDRYGKSIPMLPPSIPSPPPKFVPVSTDTPIPTIPHASSFWVYKTLSGEIAFVVYRIDPPRGKKYFTPMSWDGFSWVQKAWPDNRPLLNLDDVKQNPNKQILVVEGEKAASAARLVQSDVVVVTWSGGAQAVNKTDWSPLRGRNILLWPDNDEAGFKAMNEIANILVPFCKIKRFISQDAEKPQGWDIADAVTEGMSWKQIVEYAKPRVKEYVSPVSVIEQDITEEPPHTADDVEEDDYPVGEVQNDKLNFYKQLGINLDGNSIKLNESSLFLVLKGSLVKNIFWYDTFHQRIFTTIDGKVRGLRDYDTTYLLTILQQSKTFEGLKLTTLEAAFYAWIYRPENERNIVSEWLKSLKWDGTPRIDAFFTHYMGANESAYTQAVSKNFWLSLVARITRPGCKVDNMVVLEGAQGAGKSTALSIIGGEYFAEVALDPKNKDFAGSLQGKFLIEIGELASFTKSETEHVKQMITSATDRFRAPYGRSVQDYPRQSIFVGTTNNARYLKDETGNRRFWPILTTDINNDEIKRDREQFFAEAIFRVDSGETWHEVPVEDAKAEQAERLEVDEMTDRVEEFLIGKSEVSLFDIWTSDRVFDGLPDFKQVEQKRVAKILRYLGWSPKNMRVGGVQRKMWVRGD